MARPGDDELVGGGYDLGTLIHIWKGLEKGKEEKER